MWRSIVGLVLDLVAKDSKDVSFEGRFGNGLRNVCSAMAGKGRDGFSGWCGLELKAMRYDFG